MGVWRSMKRHGSVAGRVEHGSEPSPGAGGQTTGSHTGGSPVSRPRASTPSSPASDRLRAADTGPHGGVVTLVRAAWIAVVALVVALFVAGISAQLGQVQELCWITPCETGQLSPAGLRAIRDLGISPPPPAPPALTRACA